MIIASPVPAPEIPPVSFADFLLAGCQARGAAPAFIDAPTGRTVTFAGLAERAAEFAAGLSVRGLGRGDVVALLSQRSYA